MYLNLIQIAESFGVSESVVEGWVREQGLPHTWDRGRLIFDRAQVAEWAAAHGLAAQAGFLAPEASLFATTCRVGGLLKVGGIYRDLSLSTVPETLDKIVAGLPATPPPVRQLLCRRLRAEGGVTWAPIGGGFALPHPSARIALGRESGTLALLVLREGMSLADCPDNIPVTWLFFFIAPSPRAHLDLLGRLTRLLAHGPLGAVLMAGGTDEEIFRAIAAADPATSKQGEKA